MDKYIEQLKPVFAQVADKIGQGAEFGWEVVLQQQLTYGIIALFIAGISIIVLCLMGFLYKQIKNDEDLLGPWIFCTLVTIIGFIWASIIAILHLMNPAYYTLQFFINLAK